MEVAPLDGAPAMKPPTRGGTWEEAEPAETFDVKRFNAIRGHQAAQGREISRCLKELRQLRREPLLAMADEPEPATQNEPGSPAPEPMLAANDAGPRHGMAPIPDTEETMRNEPDAPRATPAEPEPIEALRRAIRAEIAAQMEAEEPDPERLMALTRRFSLVALRSGGPAGDMPTVGRQSAPEAAAA
jgi:hypothetical protein